MLLEKSAGALIFRKEGNMTYYLLLHYPTSSKGRANSLQGRDYWDLPKGHIEKGEKIEDTVKREVREETGLTNINIIPGFKFRIHYFFRFKDKNIFKTVTFLLAETKEKKVKISFEHIGYEWLPYEKAVERLTFKNAKEVLRKASEYVFNK